MKQRTAKLSANPKNRTLDQFRKTATSARASLLAALGLAACVSVSNANDLFNGTLDTIALQDQNNPTPVGWVVAGSKSVSGTFFDGGDSEPWCNVADLGGYGFFFKPFQGNQPAGDLLTVDLYQDNACTPGTKVTLSGYAAGEANYSGFFNTNAPAPQTVFFVEFLDGSGNGIITNTYNLIANGLPNGGPGSMALFTTPQYTAPANTATVRCGTSIRNVYGTTGAQSFFVDAFDLESVAPPGSPVITTQPTATTVSPGGTAHLSVVATGATTYQWQLYNTNISNGGNISGATTANLTITGASASNVGHYRVRVGNASGALYSASVPLALVGISFYPVVPITGKIGDTYRVDYATAVAPTTWIPLSTNVLTTSPVLVVDPGSAGSNTRFYRAVFLY
jgi:hypothetical protein